MFFFFVLTLLSAVCAQSDTYTYNLTISTDPSCSPVSEWASSTWNNVNIAPLVPGRVSACILTKATSSADLVFLSFTTFTLRTYTNNNCAQPSATAVNYTCTNVGNFCQTSCQSSFPSNPARSFQVFANLAPVNGTFAPTTTTIPTTTTTTATPTTRPATASTIGALAAFVVGVVLLVA